jgi:hypothetical protein
MRCVLPGRDFDMDGVARAVPLVVLFQALAEPVGLHADDGIALLIELRRTAQCLHCNVVFLDFLSRTLKILRADVL